MAQHLVWGLQRLKQKLTHAHLEEFEELEDALLDLRHQHYLFPERNELPSQINELIQKCDMLAHTHASSSLDELCKGQPVTHFHAPGVSENATHDALGIARPALPLPDVEVQLLTYQVPSSYCYQKNANAKEYPLVTLWIDTTHLDAPCVVTIDVSFQNYGAPTPHQYTFPPGEKKPYHFLPTLPKERLLQIKTKCAETIRISLRYIQPELREVWEDSCPVYLLSYDTALLWRYRWDGLFDFYENYLAAWITPAEPCIWRLLKQATEYHPEKVFNGYNAHSFPTKRGQLREARKIARAIFEVLSRDLEVRYINSPVVIPSEAEPNMQGFQRIYLPKDCIAALGSANCIDGSVLFASLLEHASLAPALLLIPGHALVGWRIAEYCKEYEFLETTMLDQGDFAKALYCGQTTYKDARLKGIVGRVPSSHNEDYALIVDIQDCRQKDIVSM
jgi:hypothetical protein